MLPPPMLGDHHQEGGKSLRMGGSGESMCKADFWAGPSLCTPKLPAAMTNCTRSAQDWPINTSSWQRGGDPEAPFFSEELLTVNGCWGKERHLVVGRWYSVHTLYKHKNIEKTEDWCWSSVDCVLAQLCELPGSGTGTGTSTSRGSHSSEGETPDPNTLLGVSRLYYPQFLPLVPPACG